ncbi:MAG TPA: hypothetical protein VFL98_02710 [Candidatus Paceibacterota bacterium]|nr:hypothetical protein [Candidatus Paceibacterota bacterium]
MILTGQVRLLIAAVLGLAVIGAFSAWSPRIADAFPFGGQASIVQPCFNDAIYVLLGPPRGGAFIWTPGTKTYEFGPPRHAGQWLLGLAGAPYMCIVSPVPLIIWSGTYITMMGSSQ